MFKNIFNSNSKPEYKTEIFTGIRPTGNLTVANYLGAVAPILELQNQNLSPLVFVADLHAITDREPSEVRKNVREVVADYIALGIDPSKTKIYLQSDIAGEITTLMAVLARLITVSELLRVPTLKDKLKDVEHPEIANALLLLYPVMMASDILINKSKQIPVGEDQVAHIEVTRELARSFNKKYGEVFPMPKVLQVKSLRILSLKGQGKMSKTNPAGAIFLTDSAEDVAKKIKVAETAVEGEMNEKMESLIQIGKGLAKNPADIAEIDAIISEHISGKPVMGNFKKVLTRIVQAFLADFQNRRQEIVKDPNFVDQVLKDGGAVARNNAKETLDEVMKALKLVE